MADQARVGSLRNRHHLSPQIVARFRNQVNSDILKKFTLIGYLCSLVQARVEYSLAL